jgi:hypothetical protein
MTEAIAPRILSFGKLNQIVSAYLTAGGDQAEVTHRQVAAKANGIVSSNVSDNAKFLKSIGLIQGNTGRFRLTEDGKRYAESLQSETDKASEQAPLILAKAIKRNPLFSQTLDFVTAHQPIPEKDLKDEIARIGNIDVENVSTPTGAVIDMLIVVGRLNRRPGPITGQPMITSSLSPSSVASE